METKVLNVEDLKAVAVSNQTVYEALNEGDKLSFGSEVKAEQVTRDIEGTERTWVQIYAEDGRTVSINSLTRHYSKHGNRNELQRDLSGAKNAFDVIEVIKDKTLFVDKVTEGSYQGNPTNQIRFDYAK